MLQASGLGSVIACSKLSVVDYAYGSAGELGSIRYPSGRKVVYNYGTAPTRTSRRQRGPRTFAVSTSSRCRLPARCVSIEELAPLDVPRSLHRATLLDDGRVLVTGGYTTGGVPLETTTLFDPRRDEWSAGSPMSIPRADHVAERLPDGRALRLRF